LSLGIYNNKSRSGKNFETMAQSAQAVIFREKYKLEYEMF